MYIYEKQIRLGFLEIHFCSSRGSNAVIYLPCLTEVVVFGKNQSVVKLHW